MALYNLYMLAQLAVPQPLLRIKGRPWFPRVFSFYYGYLSLRDEDMTQRVLLVLFVCKKHGFPPPLLLVGALHIPGIRYRLVDEQGFEIITKEYLDGTASW